MAIFDLKVVENGDGGDLEQLGADLAVIGGLQNMVYLGLFGGNVEQSTEGAKPEDEEAFDWWGNNLLMPNDKSIQFNSGFERALREIPLNSAGRIELEEIAKSDLEFMSDFAIVTVTISIETEDRLEIFVRAQEPDNLQSTEFIFIWDATKEELTEESA